jgi:hypothetical protein
MLIHRLTERMRQACRGEIRLHRPSCCKPPKRDGGESLSVFAPCNPTTEIQLVDRLREMSGVRHQSEMIAIASISTRAEAGVRALT